MSIKDLDFIDNFFMDEEDLKQLSQKAKEMKNRILMEEPCPIYEGDAEDWEDFWYNEDTDD
jgi:hypothetical protein|tara:strand:- start:53 stop:235 length:183 start_codon:yes stop_codon:yes gene_type:complete